MSDDDFDRELRVHLDIEAEEQRERGLSARDARDAAQRAFGNRTRVKEDIYEQSRWALLDSVGRDFQYGLRMLRKYPTYTVVVAMTLALGIGASTALFTIVHNVLLRPLAVPESDRVILVYNSYPKAGTEHAGAAAADYVDRLRDVTVFESQALFTVRNPSVDVSGVPERIHAMHATASFFRLVRVRPRQGRAFTDDEELPGRNGTVILSGRLEQRLFGGTDAVGRDVRIDGQPHTVVGVMPDDFTFIDADVQMWLPLTLTAQERAQLHANNWQYLGRLKPGATVAQAQAQIDALNAANLNRVPELRELLTNAGFHSVAVPLQDDLVHEMRTSLRLLWAGAVFVLLMGSVNVASLVLSRSRARLKEIATRVALGAGRWRVIRQLIAEHLLLTLASGVVGLGFGYAALRAFGHVRIEHLPAGAETQIDAVVVTYTLVIAAFLGVALGAVPAIGGLLGDPMNALRDGGRTATSGHGRTLRRALVVTQVAVAFMLLVGGGLLLASFRRVLAVNPGFATERVLTASVNLPQTRYPDAPPIRRFTDDALTAIRTLPGVVAVGATTSIPFGNDFSTRLIMAEGYRPNPGEGFIGPYRNIVTPGYFEAMQVRLSSGRFFTERDTAERRRVAIVDTRLARRFWPGLDPVGRQLYSPDRRDLFKIAENTPRFLVVGVVDEIKLRGLVEGVGDVGAYYFPQAQVAERGLTFAVRTAGDPSFLEGAVRGAIGHIDRELPVFDVQPMTNRAEQSLASRRSATLLAGAFGIVALLLSAIGIYGVLAYLVAQRTKEIGIRIALGSSTSAVFKMILREGCLLVAGGFALGAAGAPLLGHTLRSQLFGIRGSDPTVMSIVGATLVLVASIACVIPARRAARIDPMIALGE
jgi:predicted permease